MNKEDNSPQKPARSKSHPFWQWFWLSFLVVSLAYAWYSFYAPSNDINWVDGMTSHQELTNNSSQNTLLFFTAPWCSPCQIMKRQVFSDEEVESIVNLKLIPVTIDLGNPETSELVKHYEVGITPTTIILDSQGNILEFVVGKIGKKEFLEMIQNAEKQ